MKRNNKDKKKIFLRREIVLCLILARKNDNCLNIYKHGALPGRNTFTGFKHVATV